VWLAAAGEHGAAACFDAGPDDDVFLHGVLLVEWMGLAAGEDVFAAIARFDTGLDADVLLHDVSPLVEGWGLVATDQVAAVSGLDAGLDGHANLFHLVSPFANKHRPRRAKRKALWDELRARCDEGPRRKREGAKQRKSYSVSWQESV
jgi:hypothetical protein